MNLTQSVWDVLRQSFLWASRAAATADAIRVGCAEAKIIAIHAIKYRIKDAIRVGCAEAKL